MAFLLACEQALCLGKNSEEREGTKGLFTGYVSSPGNEQPSTTYGLFNTKILSVKSNV